MGGQGRSEQVMAARATTPRAGLRASPHIPFRSWDASWAWLCSASQSTWLGGLQKGHIHELLLTQSLNPGGLLGIEVRDRLPVSQNRSASYNK